MDSLSIVPQRRKMDCGVAALASLLGIPYEDVYVAACAVAPNVARHGLYLHEVRSVALKLGTPLIARRSYDIETDVGILSVRGKSKGKKTEFWHYVVLRKGDVIDPDGARIIDADDYFAEQRARPCTLLVVNDG
jgi:hypothetical protein